MTRHESLLKQMFMSWSLVARVLFGFLTKKTTFSEWIYGEDAWDSGLCAERVAWYGKYAFIQHQEGLLGRGVRFELARISTPMAVAINNFYEGFGK